MNVEVIRSAALSTVPHGFLGRPGGVSSGDLQGLNVGFGSSDDREAIAENRRRAIGAVLPDAQLATVHQVHSGRCVYADAPWPQGERPRADAMVTDRPGFLLGILTADCAPVLFADHEAGVVGAAHAGWRGAFEGVTDSAIAMMEELGARRERIAAAIGPCIAQASYEVDDAFRERFLDQDKANASFFTIGPAGTPHFDLPGYVAACLGGAGIRQVDVIGQDTYADSDLFFSYRRATHRGDADYGRQISMVAVAQGRNER